MTVTACHHCVNVFTRHHFSSSPLLNPVGEKGAFEPESLRVPNNSPKNRFEKKRQTPIKINTQERHIDIISR